MEISGDTKTGLIDMNLPKGIIFNFDLPVYEDIGVRATGTINENGEVDIKDVLSYDLINKPKNK
jgi:hypothetical protein